MSKNLAIDANEDNYDECLRYSSLIREMFGNRTFILEHLKNAMYELPAILAQALNQTFNLFEADASEMDCKSFYSKALSMLAGLDSQYRFLTQTYIEYLKQLDAFTINSDLKSPSIELLLIEATPLSPRAKNALTRSGIKTIGDLRAKTLKEILNIRNIGEDTGKEIQQVMKKDYEIIID